MIDANYIIGKRFSWPNLDAPDVTFVSISEKVLPGQTKAVECVSAHAEDGNVQWLPLKSVLKAVQRGSLVESTKGAPFTVERTRRAW